MGNRTAGSALALVLLVVAAATGCRATRSAGDMNLPDFDARWDYNRPAETEAIFRRIAAEQAGAPAAYRAELETQIARTLSLQRRFAAAHAVLDGVEAQLAGAGMDVARVRCLLERGRTFNSAGQPERATPLFREAARLAPPAGRDDLAVDALHMLAISDAGNALAWNEAGLELAARSGDPRARRWRGSLANNIGWTLHERGDYAAALTQFRQALEYRVQAGEPDNIQIARWCVARCLRSLGRCDEALVILRELAAAPRPDAEPGYTYEEIGECLLAQGSAEAAQPYFAQAYERLSAIEWLAADEPERVARLKRLGAVE